MIPKQSPDISIRIRRPTPQQRVLIRALSREERLQALLDAAYAKLRAASGGDENRARGDEETER